MSVQSGTTLLQANFNLLKSLGGTFGSTNIAANFGGSNQGVNVQFTPGAGANQFNNVYEAGLSVASGSPVSVNLTDGSALMPDGAASNFADIVLLVIRNNGAAVLTVGGGTNAVTSIGTILVNPGATVVVLCPLATGYPVTATTACVLKFASATGTLAVDVMAVGH